MIKTSALPNENMPSDMSQTCRDQIDQKDAFNFLFFVEGELTEISFLPRAFGSDMALWSLKNKNISWYESPFEPFLVCVLLIWRSYRIELNNRWYITVIDLYLFL